MTKTSQKIIFFGTEDYSLIALKALVEAGFNIAAVVTKPDAPRGRGHKISEPPVKVYAKQHDITVWQPTTLRDISEDIKALQPVAGVLVAYGKIIPQSTIDLFQPGIINIHPSLLPRWRGPSPIEAAILQREPETGVTIMQLEAGMDSGPIYLQETVKLSGHETKYELYDQLFGLGSQMLINILPDILSGKLQPTPQNHAEATYCQMLSKDNSLIDPTALTAVQAEAQVRAFLSFPKTRVRFGGQQIIVTKAHVSNQPKSPLSIKCSDDNYLIIDELVAPSGKTMSASSYLHGYAAGA